MAIAGMMLGLKMAMTNNHVKCRFTPISWWRAG